MKTRFQSQERVMENGMVVTVEPEFTLRIRRSEDRDMIVINDKLHIDKSTQRAVYFVNKMAGVCNIS